MGLFGADSVLFLSGRGELVGVLSFLGFSFGWGVGESVGDFLDRPELRSPPEPRFRMLPKAARGLVWEMPAFAKICVCVKGDGGKKEMKEGGEKGKKGGGKEKEKEGEREGEREGREGQEGEGREEEIEKEGGRKGEKTRQRREGIIMTMKHQWKQLKYSGTSTVTAVTTQ